MNNNNLPTRKRSIGVGLLIGILLGLIAVISVRCSKDDPSSPVSFTPAPAPDLSSPTSTWFPPANGGTSGTNPTPGPSDPDSPAKSRYSWKILDNQGNFTVSLTSTGATSGRVGVACYENPNRTTGADQIYFSSKEKLIDQGGTVGLSVGIPECEAWQCDAFEGGAITTDGDVFYGRRLIVGRSGGAQGSCEPPPPPPPCPNPPCNPPPSCDLEQLNHDAAAECDENNFTLNVEACTFECNPPPQCDAKQLTIDANASCEFGVKGLDFIECTFECNPKPPCEPTGEPECQEQTWDTNSCSWVGECVCEPTGEPECQEQTWSTDSCSWVGECICDPVGEPECQEQTWSTDSCSWVGECPEPGVCIYEYGGPPTDKETECLALTDTAFWSDGSQHCVIDLPGVSADKWNLTPGQSHPDCLRKQDD